MATKTTLQEQIDDLFRQVGELRAEIAELKRSRPVTWTDLEKRLHTNAISPSPYDLSQRRGTFGR